VNERISTKKKRRKAPSALMHCDELAKDYGDARALGPISLTIEAGEAVALVGHNGSGKSTFLSLIAGRIEPTEGELRIAGYKPGEQNARALVSYLPDNPVLYEDLSLGEHLEYLSRLHGTTPEEQNTAVLLEAFSLTSRIDDLPSDYSRGLRQKAAISIGLCRPYRLLLIDEPFSGLDRAGRSTLIQLIGTVKAGNGAVLVATHDQDAVDIFDRVVTLEHGEIVDDTGREQPEI
jgi:ABC-type multidrug transport system ATPase subunit